MNSDEILAVALLLPKGKREEGCLALSEDELLEGFQRNSHDSSELSSVLKMWRYSCGSPSMDKT